MIDLDPIVTDYAPRPKRKYTVTDRVVAACRANLEHANAVPREINPQDATEEKLAHAIGMLSWRWIAGVRLECDLETLKIYRLIEARGGGTSSKRGGSRQERCAVFAFCSPEKQKGGIFRKNEAIRLLILKALLFFIGQQSR
jgi:hypothetical protein